MRAKEKREHTERCYALMRQCHRRKFDHVVNIASLITLLPRDTPRLEIASKVEEAMMRMVFDLLTNPTRGRHDPVDPS